MLFPLCSSNNLSRGPTISTDSGKHFHHRIVLNSPKFESKRYPCLFSLILNLLTDSTDKKTSEWDKKKKRSQFRISRQNQQFTTTTITPSYAPWYQARQANLTEFESHGGPYSHSFVPYLNKKFSKLLYLHYVWTWLTLVAKAVFFRVTETLLVRLTLYFMKQPLIWHVRSCFRNENKIRMYPKKNMNQ